VIAAQCTDLSMVYKSFLHKENEALRSVNLKIEDNQIFGILGPNGAGKTTLISIMATLLKPSRGNVKILGMDINSSKNLKRIREKINLTSGNPNLIWSLTPFENLRYYAFSYGLNNKKKIEELLEFFELEKQKDIEFNKLSTGNKQKVTLARAFINNPELVFLDEPTKGLDPGMAKKLRKKIKEYQKEKNITIVLTTHYMAEAELLCERIAFINKGRIVAEGTQNDLKNILKIRDRIIIKIDGKLPDLSQKLNLEGVQLIEVNKGGKYTFYVDDSENRLEKVVKKVSEYGSIKNIKIKEVDLEDVFSELSKRDL